LPEPTQFEGYQADVVCARAAEWLRTSPDRPGFTVVSLEAPHPPYDAPAAGVAARDPAALVLAGNVPRGGEGEAKARRELAGYYAQIEATDRAIGRLVAAVDARGLPTITVFTSVHGDMHGAHGLFRKGWPYEESIRVPLLVHGLPGPAGRSDALVSLLDLPRWALAWAESPAGDLPPSADRQEISMPSVVRQAHQCDRIWHGWRTRTRKEISNADGTPWLCFDLANDPGELRNLALT